MSIAVGLSGEGLPQDRRVSIQPGAFLCTSHSQNSQSTGRWLWVQITRNKEKPRCEKESERSFSPTFNAKGLYSHEKFLEALDSS